MDIAKRLLWIVVFGISFVTIAIAGGLGSCATYYNAISMNDGKILVPDTVSEKDVKYARCEDQSYSTYFILLDKDKNPLHSERLSYHNDWVCPLKSNAKLSVKSIIVFMDSSKKWSVWIWDILAWASVGVILILTAWGVFKVSRRNADWLVHGTKWSWKR